ncbi:MAG: YibE/F family protein [Candidatus Woesebacteria bacterium]|jgi:uncharacterized membrane protein
MKFILKSCFTILFLIVLQFLTVNPVAAQTEEVSEPQYMEGKVTKVVETGQETLMDDLVPFQQLEIKVTKGQEKGQIITVKNSAATMGMGNVQYQTYEPGDKVKIVFIEGAEGKQYYLDGELKKDALIALLVLFVLVVLVVGRIWGALSLLGLLISFIVIFKLIIPLIIKGTNPVLAAIIGSVIIIPSTFYISHGFNKKTHIGVAATFLGLLITGLLAIYFVDASHLTGFASEEAGFLQVEKEGAMDIKGLLLAGIIIATLGILDDVTIGQASTVKQLKKANKKMSFSKLFINAMKVGQDHISSMVNTLILVYSGSALPLLLLFFDSEKTFLDVIELELIAEEIVRMLVGSIGLVLAAPLATVMAAYVFAKQELGKK